jgi:hypothetical protein
MILKLAQIDIYLTPVAPTCSMGSDGGFPEGSTGV